MLIKTRGIIFRSLKYSETSIIADIFTEEKGLRSFIISGVRSKKARVSASILQVMTLVDLVTYFREDKDLHRIKEIKIDHVYSSLPFDIVKGAVGLFMVELARKTIQESEENRKLFTFLFESFRLLDTTENPVSNFHLSFMVELSAFLGFMPGGEHVGEKSVFDMEEGVFVDETPMHVHFLNEIQSAFLNQFLNTAIWESHTIKIDRQNRKELLNNLLIFYKLHLENFQKINAHEILEEVLEG
jgi:DNA repair protein RecO (recombination protein O)